MFSNVLYIFKPLIFSVIILWLIDALLVMLSVWGEGSGWLGVMAVFAISLIASPVIGITTGVISALRIKKTFLVSKLMFYFLIILLPLIYSVLVYGAVQLIGLIFHT